MINSDEFRLESRVPLAPLTTLGVGGPARYYVRAISGNEITAALRYAGSKAYPLLLIGGGSNLVISDAGFDGLVLHIASTGIYIERESKKATNIDSDIVEVNVEAGENWDNFVAWSVDNNFAGIECLSGIPGSVGGTPVQNVGAYGQEVSETIISVKCLDLQTMRIVEKTNEECGFEYRKSIFNTTHIGRFVILSVRFALRKDGPPKIAYADFLKKIKSSTPSLLEVRNTVLEIRRSKSMVLDADDVNSHSAGSFFKNPIVSREVFEDIKTNSGTSDIPFFDAGPGVVKIPAAWLIENAGFEKGFRLGRAGISKNHSLALINLGNASAAEIIALKDMIIERVRDRFGLLLKPEPVFVGFDE